MQIQRKIEQEVCESLSAFPVVAILGPRQVGKTTLAKKISSSFPEAIYLDLELPSDQAKLSDAEFFLRRHEGKLVCLDEVQRQPEIFAILRSLIDAARRPGRFLVLGSATPTLLRQSSESLAGRIAYHELAPLGLDELVGAPYSWQDLMVRGGFPDSLFASSDKISLKWRENFLLTFVERDLRLLGLDCQPTLMRRLCLMLSHINGQLINYSKLAQSLDTSHPTIKRYLDILCGSYMLLRLEPYLINLKRRLGKPWARRYHSGKRNLGTRNLGTEQKPGHKNLGTEQITLGMKPLKPWARSK